ncbi:MAG: mechanosensitive ion channel family protein [Thalassotalea sp.]
MEALANFLNIVVVSFNDHTFTIGNILMVPLWLIISVLITKILIRRISKELRNRNKDPNLIQLIERGAFILAIIIIFLTTLSLLQVPITAFAFLSGAVAIGFGFGAQNIINNFISGWILIGEKPIRIGDFLEIEETKGIVEEINTRSTRIRRVDGVHLLVPNSKLLENTVINWTLRDRMVRGTVRVGVAYGSPCKKVAELILQAAKEQEDVLSDPEAAVFFIDFGDNALIFDVYFWINSQVEGGLRLMASNIRFRIDELLAEHEIVIAFPQRDIHVDGKLTIQRAQKETDSTNV